MHAQVHHINGKIKVDFDHAPYLMAKNLDLIGMTICLHLKCIQLYKIMRNTRISWKGTKLCQKEPLRLRHTFRMIVIHSRLEEKDGTGIDGSNARLNECDMWTWQLEV